jgi:hypothetical protein
MFAKCQNVYRGRSENFWSSDPPSYVELVDAQDVIAKLLYAAINPVKDNLVERAHQWPGVGGLSWLLTGRAMSARRPLHFFRADGSMPEYVELQLSIPPELGDAEQIRGTLRGLVEAAEKYYASRRAREGKRVLGRRGVLRQSWRESPRTQKPSSDLRPTVAARSVWSRIEALQRDAAFLAAYRAARTTWIAGLPTVFPAGTYWLRRFAGVTVAQS